MQIYGIKLNYFFRFGEKNNSIVFDLLPEDKAELKQGNVTLDEIYVRLHRDPVTYINDIKDKNAVTNLLGIVGMRDGNIDASNGMGKSTLLEAICYVFYDKVVRKHIYTTKEGNAGVSVATKINNEYHPKMRESFVEIIFEEGGKIYRLKRGRKFSKNKKSNSPILELDEYKADGTCESLSGHTIGRTEEESLRKIFTIDYDVFVNGLMFGQGDAGKYLFGTDKVKKDMLINILNLNSIVVGQLDAIRKEKNRVDKQISNLEAKVEAYKEKLEKGQSPKELKAEMASCKEKIEKFDKEIISLDKQIEKLASSDIIKDIEETKKRIDELKKQIDDAESSKYEKTKAIQAVLDKIDEEGVELAKVRIPKLDKTIINIDAKLEKIKESVAAFDQNDCDQKLEKIAKAKDAKPKYEAELARLRKEHAQLSEDIGKFKSDQSRIQKELDKFNERLKTGEDFECSYCKTMVSIDHVKEHINQYNEDLKKVEDDLQIKMTSLKESVQKVEDFEAKLAKINEWITGEAVIRNRVEKHKENAEIVKSLKEERDEANKELVVCNDKVEKLREERATHREKIKGFEDQFAETNKTVGKQIEECQKSLSDQRQQSKVIEDQIGDLKSQKAEIAVKLDAYKEKMGSITNALNHLKTDYAQYKSLKEDLDNSRKELSRWLILEDVHGLDGIQTRIIKKYLPLLNSYIKNYLDILTDGEMSINMEINDKSKIDMVITGGSSDTFEMLSGGEKMLVKLAVDISLALLSFVRSSQQPELICLDEIFGQLDGKNTGAVFNLLNALGNKFSRVLLISHKPYINEKIRNKIYVNKQSGTYGMSEIKSIEV